MFCSNCGSEIMKGAKFCAKCGTLCSEKKDDTRISGEKKIKRNTRVEDKKKISSENKKKRIGLVIILIVVALVLISVGGYFLLRANAPDPNIDNLSLSADIIEYNDDIMIEVKYSNESMWDERAEFPIYINDELLFENIFDIEAKSSIKKEYSLSDLPAGEYLVQVGWKKLGFTVVVPALFEARLENIPEYFVAGKNYQVDYVIENVGESKGEYTLEHIFNGKIIKGETVEIEGDSTHNAVIDIFVHKDDSGSIRYGLDGEIYETNIYTPTTLEHNKKLMENTVRGYGYIVIENHSERDIIAYVSKADDDAKAVGVICVASGKKVKFYSFPHGTYHLFIQTGDDWIEELNRFATNQIMRKNNADLVFKNNVSKASGGTYTYWTLKVLDDFETTRYYTDVKKLPSILTD